MAQPLLDNVIDQLLPKLATGLQPQFAAMIEEAIRRACAQAGTPALTPSKDCPPGSACDITPKDPSDPCNEYVELVRNVMRKRCKAMYSECDARRLAEAVRDSSWVLYEDQVGRLEMSFQLTGAVGPGQNQSTPQAATTFAAGPSIPASGSILVVQDASFALPWRPGCLDIDIAPADGITKEAAYSGLLVSAFVALRSDLATIMGANPIAYYGERWNKYQTIRGKELYCADSCKSVDLDGPCVDNDWIGKDAVLLLQIDNLDNTNAVTWRNAEVKFKGIKKVCCDDCFSGKSCGC